jgi:hypothetical protein
VHLERVPLRRVVDGTAQALIPNPEWLTEKDAWALRFMDLVLCKTRHAVPIFASAGCTTEYLGFTSNDHHVANIEPDRTRWLHVASFGWQKGTNEIVEAWRRNPHWPQLTILAGRRYAPISSARNLRVIDEWLSDADLHALMQRSGVHLCPQMLRVSGIRL